MPDYWQKAKTVGEPHAPAPESFGKQFISKDSTILENCASGLARTPSSQVTFDRNCRFGITNVVGGGQFCLLECVDLTHFPSQIPSVKLDW